MKAEEICGSYGYKLMLESKMNVWLISLSVTKFKECISVIKGWLLLRL